MPRRTWVPGEIVTAPNVQQFLMDQSIMSCTSSTRPASPAEPWIVAETDTDSLSVYNGTAWRRLPGGGWGPNSRIVSLTRAAPQVVGASTVFDITWDTEIRDTEAWITTPASTLTVPTSGLYLITIATTLTAGTFSVQPTFYNGAATFTYPSVGLSLLLQSCMYMFVAGDTIKARGTSGAGGATFTSVLELIRLSW